MSDYGLSRVLSEQRVLAAEDDQMRISLEAFSAATGLSTRTLSRMLNRASPVDFRTLETLYFALNLVPSKADYVSTETYVGNGPSVNPLPRQSSPLIGRARVLESAEELIAKSRLVTLTGPGGIGKTRLAIELARHRETIADERVWFFDLATVKEPRDSIMIVAASLGIATNASGAFTTVREQLSTEPGVLVLDGCENVARALVPFILEILRTCHSLRVIATSRERLAVAGEHVFEVPRLPIPGSTTRIIASNALEYPAIALFTERARSGNPGFVLDDAIAPVIAELVRRLDGLPLGIELAAARTKEIFTADFLAYLQAYRRNNGADGNDPNAHNQSMSALMDWSFERLTPDERLAYCRASVFAGPFDANALAAVCLDSLSLENASRVLSQLVQKALLEVDDRATPPRFTYLVMVRQYARERLHETRDHAMTQWLHALHYLQVAQHIMRYFRSENQGEALNLLSRDYANVRGALEWSFSTHNEHIGAVLVSELPEYWDARGHYREGEGWIRRALQIDCQLTTSQTLAELNGGLGLLLYRQSRVKEASTAASASLAQFEAAEDNFGACRARNVLAIIDFDAGAIETARERHLENLRKGHALFYPRIIVAALSNLGRIELEVDGAARAALSRFQQSLELAMDIGRQTLVANALRNTANAYSQLGNMFLAIEFSKRALHILRELENDALYCVQAVETAIFRMRASGYRGAISDFEIALEAVLVDPYRSELCDQLDTIAELLVDDGEAVRAVVLLVAIAAQRSRDEAITGSTSIVRHQNIIERTRKALSSDAYTDARAVAVGLSIESAFRLALLGPDSDPREMALTIS